MAACRRLRVRQLRCHGETLDGGGSHSGGGTTVRPGLRPRHGPHEWIPRARLHDGLVIFTLHGPINETFAHPAPLRMPSDARRIAHAGKPRRTLEGGVGHGHKVNPGVCPTRINFPVK